MKGFVYILQNNLEKLYVGSTDDLSRRLKQHQTGHTQTTKRMGDFKLIFSQEFENLTMARKIESRLKKLKRKDYLLKIIKDGFIKMV